jgi:hypothetical protein
VENSNTSPLLFAVTQLSQLLREYGQQGKQWREQSTGIRPVAKVINKKQFTYIIPPTSPYFTNPAALFELYKPPRHTTTKSKNPQPSSPPSPSPPQTSSPPSPNPFDSLEQEEMEIEHQKVIIPTKYKKKPKKPLPNPALCKGSQAVSKQHTIATQTSAHSLNTSSSLWDIGIGIKKEQSTQTEILDRPIIPVKASILSASLIKTPQKQTNNTTTTTTTTIPKRKTFTSDSDIQTKHVAKKLVSTFDEHDKRFQTKEFSAFMALMDEDLHSTDSGSDYQDSSGDSED